MILLIRILPYIVALLEALVFYVQLRQPLSYPWLVAVGVILFPVAAVIISWRRLGLGELVYKMTPSFLLLATLAFALLLAEGRTAIFIVIGLAALASFVSLELLFLLLYHPSRYPVNGLSHINIAYVPLVVWYAASTSNGVVIFMHLDRNWHAVLLVILGLILFRTTGHPGASRAQNTRWALVGALVGAHAGLLGVMLPLGLSMQGFLAAALMAAALRTRRYMHDPKPSHRQGWIEGTALAVSLVLALVTAKWL